MTNPADALSQLSTELNYAGQAWLWLRTNLIELSGAFAVMVIGFFVVRTLGRTADKALGNAERIDPTVAKFLGNVIKYALWVILGVTVLTQFGVQTTTIIAALGGLALAVGLALQGTLSNVAAGVMILLQRPFRVGETISAGPVMGTVQGIGLFTTEITQLDGLYVMVPNNELWNKAIVNFSRQPTRRFELIIGISYTDNMALAREELLALARADERVLAEPEPVAFVAALGASSVDIGLRVWCATPDYLRLTWDLNEAAKRRFDEIGISIPFPQREITIRQAGPLLSGPAGPAGPNGG
ncbi:MAG: mechanosensitive ion channel family protein [Erythrobacter sp.]